MKKVYPDAKAALAGVLKDGMLIMAGGFGLCGIPETLIHAIVTLHEKIKSGEITRRRGDSASGGAELTVDAPLPDRHAAEPTHVKVKVGNRR